MKRELGYIYREPQIILQRAAGWLPLPYTVSIRTTIFSYSNSVFKRLIEFKNKILFLNNYTLALRIIN